MKNKNKTYVILGILFISIIIILVFRKSVTKAIDDNKVVLEVNNDHVIKREYKIRFNALKENAIQFSSRTDILDQVVNGKKYKELLKNELITILTEELLCLQEAKRRNIHLTKQEENEIRKYIEDLKANNGMKNYFSQYLKKIGSNEKHFYEDLYKTRVINKLYATITTKVVIDDSDLQNYYNTNKDEFQKVKIIDIFLKVDKKKDDPKKNELAKKAISELQKGTKFEDLVKRYSEDENTRANNGVIDYFRKGEKEAQYGSVFEEEVFKLSVGQTSNVIKTINGYHIVKVLDKKHIPFKEVRDEIHSKLLKQKKDEFFKLYIENLKNSARINIYKDKVSDL